MSAAVLAVAVAVTALLPGLATGQEVVDLRTLDLPRWRLEEVLRLGSINGEHDAFVFPSLQAVDSMGRLYVMDLKLPAVRVFSPDGEFLRQIGRKGPGPGEYMQPYNVELRGDTIWIVDFIGGQMAAYKDGGVLKEFSLEPAGPGVRPPLPTAVLGLDSFVVVVPPGLGGFGGHDVGWVTFEQSVVLRNRSGTRTDTLFTYTRNAGFIITHRNADGMSVVPTRPIRRLPRHAYNAEFNTIAKVALTADPREDFGEFRVVLRHPDGKVVAARRFRYRPVVMPESVKDSLRDVLRSRYATSTVPDARKDMQVALEYLDLNMPHFLPPVTRAPDRGENGTWWIARESLPGAIATRYLVLDSALTPLATLELPPEVTYLTGPVSRSHLWAIVKDELDVPYIVRYRIYRE